MNKIRLEAVDGKFEIIDENTVSYWINSILDTNQNKSVEDIVSKS